MRSIHLYGKEWLKKNTQMVISNYSFRITDRMCFQDRILKISNISWLTHRFFHQKKDFFRVLYLDVFPHYNIHWNQIPSIIKLQIVTFLTNNLLYQRLLIDLLNLLNSLPIVVGFFLVKMLSSNFYNCIYILRTLMYIR